MTFLPLFIHGSIHITLQRLESSKYQLCDSQGPLPTLTDIWSKGTVHQSLSGDVGDEVFPIQPACLTVFPSLASGASGSQDTYNPWPEPQDCPGISPNHWLSYRRS